MFGITLLAGLDARTLYAEACSHGDLRIFPEVSRAGQPVLFEVWDGLGYCSGLQLVNTVVAGSTVRLELEANSGGPAACPGGYFSANLPLLGAGSYEVTARLTLPELQFTCDIGQAPLEVQPAPVRVSMLDDSAFDRGLSAWNASAGWVAEAGTIRSSGFAQVSQCVPVAGGEEYRLEVTARGEGAQADVGVGVFYFFESCGSVPVGTAGVIRAVPADQAEAVDLSFQTPTSPSSTIQVYANVVIYNEGTAAPLVVEAATLERPSCSASAELVCLHGGRFEAALNWRAFDGESGHGRVVTQANDSSLWWFFSPTNWEMVVKVLRACDLGRHWWVFAAGATNVEWLLEVYDSSTGASWSHQNPLGTTSPAVTETSAIACAPSE